MRRILLCAGVVLLLGPVAPTARADITYDLAADWSDASNPSGAWSYGIRSASGAFAAFPLHVNNYINVGPPAFTGNQPAWTDTTQTGSNGTPEGLAKSVGNSLFDFPAGRVGGHTPVSSNYLAAQWTAPQAGTVNVSGDVWLWRNLGRTEGVSVFVNGAPLFSDVPIPFQTGTNSGHPFLLSDAAVAAGGTASELLNIPVKAGDTVTLAARRLTTEDFVGMDFTIRLTPTAVPEPGSLTLAGLAAFALAGLCRIRR
jgi:hypothetical protein